ncbi:hypothetical protein ACJJIP_08285 [Microbulbifer sp. VTAC004]|uniref:hypothetical protein n=1 Tax=Microbulbifer sp. VTAC004 TaxID=3243386 RepID=UPI0040399B81
MNRELGEQIKNVSPDESFSLVRSILEGVCAHNMSTNEWLYLYEMLYARIGDSETTDLSYAEAAVEILSHLQGENSSNMNSFLVQELNLRVRLIKIYGVGGGLLDLDYIFLAVKSKLCSTDPSDISENWRELQSCEDIARLRSFKNLLGPISLLKDIDIENEFFTDWLALRGALP